MFWAYNVDHDVKIDVVETHYDGSSAHTESMMNDADAAEEDSVGALLGESCFRNVVNASDAKYSPCRKIAWAANRKRKRSTVDNRH